jgi:hypothetical protein
MTLLPLTAVLALNLALVTAHTYVPILNAAKPMVDPGAAMRPAVRVVACLSARLSVPCPNWLM